MYNPALERDVSEMIEDFCILDAASADYCKRQMDKADAEFERDNGNCIQCDAKLHNGHCNCNQRGQ